MVELRFSRKYPLLFVFLPTLVPIILVVYYAYEGFRGDLALAVVTLLVLIAIWLPLAASFVPQGRLRVDHEGITVIRGWSRIQVPWIAVREIRRTLVQVRRGGADQVLTEAEVGTVAFRRLLARGDWAYILDVRFDRSRGVQRRGYFVLIFERLELQPAALTDPGLEEALGRYWQGLGRDLPASGLGVAW